MGHGGYGSRRPISAFLQGIFRGQARPEWSAISREICSGTPGCCEEAADEARDDAAAMGQFRSLRRVNVLLVSCPTFVWVRNLCSHLFCGGAKHCYLMVEWWSCRGPWCRTVKERIVLTLLFFGVVWFGSSLTRFVTCSMTHLRSIAQTSTSFDLLYSTAVALVFLIMFSSLFESDYCLSVHHSSIVCLNA